MTSGTFNYLGPMRERPVTYTHARDAGNLNIDPHRLPVHDMRGISTSFAKEGFVLADQPVAIDPGMDSQTIAAIYHPPLLALTRELTGAPKIILSPPILRWSKKAALGPRKTLTPATQVHCDYDRESFHALTRDAIADDSDKDHWLAGRYAAFNTWRVLTPPPQDLPLAVIDRSTVKAEDYVVGSIYESDAEDSPLYVTSYVRYSPMHRWFYVANMTLDDTLIFLGFDSANDGMPGNPHSAFEDKSSGDKAVPRISCEVRAFAFWGA